MVTIICRPGEPAPRNGEYEAFGPSGSSAGVIVDVAAGESLPTLPEGYVWRPRSGRSTSDV